MELGALKIDEFAIGRDGQGRGSWSKKILMSSTFRGYPEKTIPGIQVEEWSKK